MRFYFKGQLGRGAAWMTVVTVLLTGICGGADETKPATEGDVVEPAGAVEKVSFIKDGRLDLAAAVKYFEDLYRSRSSIAEMELTVTRPRRTRTLRMKAWSLGEEKALIVIETPAREKGTATLKVGDNLWNYLPKIRRTIRIPPSMMLAPWMGSDFTNDDLVHEASYSKDYEYGLVGPSEEPKGWLVRFKAKPKVVGLWKRFELVVSEEGTLPLKAIYYDRKDRASREITWDRVRIVDGKRIPTRLVLIPLDKVKGKGKGEEQEEKTGVSGEKNRENYKTEIIYHDIDFDVAVPESTFSLSRLEQKR